MDTSPYLQRPLRSLTDYRRELADRQAKQPPVRRDRGDDEPKPAPDSNGRGE